MSGATSPEGQVDFVNDRWLQFTGLVLDEAFGWKWEAVLHPDDRTRVVADWRTALKNGRAMESEARVRRADGEYCWWFIRNVPLRDETGKLVRWYGTAIDIEDRKRAEQALRKSEERWRSVFENSAIGVALTDLNGRFLATNHVYQTIVGYTEEELRALCFLDVTHEDYREANWALITELLEGKRQQFQIEKKYLRKDGSSIWVSNNVSLVPGTERVPRFIMALSEDITQRKRAEEALQRSEGYLAEAQKLTHTGSWAVQVPQMENAHSLQLHCQHQQGRATQAFRRLRQRKCSSRVMADTYCSFLSGGGMLRHSAAFDAKMCHLFNPLILFQRRVPLLM